MEREGSDFVGVRGRNLVRSQLEEVHFLVAEGELYRLKNPLFLFLLLPDPTSVFKKLVVLSV